MLLPLLADVFIGREYLQRFETLGEVVRHQESRQMVTKLLVSVVVVTIDRRLFERAVHALYLTNCPRMIRFGQAMLNLGFGTDAVEQQWQGIAVIRAVGELNAIVRQQGVDLVGDSSDEMTEEFGSDQSALPLVQFGKSKLRGAVNRPKRYNFPASVRTSAMST